MKLLFATLFVASSLISSAFSADLAGCRPQLERALCYSPVMPHWAESPSLKSLKSYQERACSPVSSSIKDTLVSVYEQYPREVQQAFCEIKKIFVISGDVSYGALADYYFDLSTVKFTGRKFSGKPIGYVLEISEKNRFKGESTADYVTRVFRARFGNAGGNPDSLPKAIAKDPFGTNGALATTIVHEIGHMIGRSQKVTSTYFLPLSEGNWSKLSFKLVDGSYSLRHVPESYGQLMGFKMLSNNDVPTTFELFRKAGVATLYGATVPQEDFAEFFMLMFYGDLKWSIDGKVVFDLQTEMNANPSFIAKKNIIQSLLALPEPFSLKNRGTVSGEIGVM